MALFQQSVLKKYINDLNKERLEQAWLLFKSHFQNITIQANIRDAKEEEYQEGFVRDLFVNIFGYTLKPLFRATSSTSQCMAEDVAAISYTDCYH